MALVPFGTYAPDISDLNSQMTSALANIVPRGDGYGPFQSLQAFTQALPAACRGGFVSYNADGSVTIFAGTATRLYVLDNTTLAWSDVSKGATAYPDVPADAQWRFAQFNSFIIAVQQNVPPQVWDLTSSTAFDDLAGSPPQAGGVTVINRFVVLYDLLSNPNRVQWSGLNAATTWTSGTNYSDYQDLPDGGRVRAVLGSEWGLIAQQRALRRMIFVPGAPITFQIERIATDRGILAQLSACEGGGRVFFLSTSGFVEVAGDGTLTPIGLERVDRTIAADLDTGNLQLCVGAVDPKRFLVVFAYKSLAGQSGLFDKGLVYHWMLKKWAPVALSGEYLLQASIPGLTLENLDTLAPGYSPISNAANNGSGLIRLTVGSTSGWSTGDSKTIRDVTGTTEANGTWTITVINGTTIDLQGSTFANAYVSGGYVAGSVDAMTVSLDELSSVALPSLAAVSSEHKLGLFTGDALEATLETAETIGTRQRVNVNGVQFHTDAESAFGSIGGRDRLSDALAYGSESEMDSDGYCPVLENVRSGRVRLRIPAATAWTYATGAEPEIMPGGSRF